MRVRIGDDGKTLSLDGTRFPAIWLLGNAQDAAMRDPGNGQRLITMSDLPANPRIASAQVVGDTVNLEIDGRVLSFQTGWLMAGANDRPRGDEMLPENAVTSDGTLADIPNGALPALQSDPGTFSRRRTRRSS